MKIYCMGCKKEMEVSLLTGEVIYSHRPDLYKLKFWQCNCCGSYVGAHKETGKPLGIIPSKEMKKARTMIHTIMDPIWLTKRMRRKDVYAALSKVLGRTYHTAELTSMHEVACIKKEVMRLRESVCLSTL